MEGAAVAINTTQVFTDGEADAWGNSYGCFRVPSIIRTRTSRLLVFVEGRNPGAKAGACKPDVGANRPILMRSSDDDGATWSAISIAAPPSNESYNYPSPFIVGNRVHLHYQVWARGTFRVSSDDDGRTWSAPTGPIKSLSDIKCGGMFGAASLPSGRLVLPCGKFVAISDDGGDTWRASKGSNVTLGAGILSLGEEVVRADGRKNGLSMFIRVRTPDGLANHAIAQSDDGGESWGSARLLMNISGTTCQGAVGHDPSGPPGNLLLSAPHYPRGGLGGRRNLSVWSFDGAKEDAYPVLRFDVWKGAAGYSCFEGSSKAKPVSLVFEAGNNIYDWGVKLAVLPLIGRS